MSEIFVDAYYFIARLNRRDQHHDRAKVVRLPEEVVLVTSEWVLVEVANTLAKTEARPQFQYFVHEFRRSTKSNVVPASSRGFTQALDLYHQHRDKHWSLTDCTSFLIMRERGIRDALTGDRHFEQAGFVALLK